MKIKQGAKYRLLIELMRIHDENNPDGKLDEGYLLFPGTEYEVTSVIQKNNREYVYIHTDDKNEFEEGVEIKISFDLFNTCFEEVVE